jgi:hypothetical protein
MRRLVAAAMLLAVVIFAPVGCKRKKKSSRLSDDEGLTSVVNVNDPAHSAQLVRGFYNLESDSWRWSAGKFVVVLRPPVGAAQKGARLELKFMLHENIFSKTGPITVSASVNGTALPPETFSQPGDYTYAETVPPTALASDAVTVEFATNKVWGPTDQDKRELALIVRSMGLVDKDAPPQ